MGHTRLGTLRMTRSWQRVVELLEIGADAGAVAAAAQQAAQRGLRLAEDDPALVRTLWLLTQLPVAARSDDYVAHLRDCGIDVSDAPSLMELVGAFTEAVDTHVQGTGGRTDLGEMAELSAAETLSTLVGDRLPSLFGTTPDDVRRELAALGTSKQFGIALRDFFSRLTHRHLSYYLSRVASDQVGGDGRFASVNEHAAFNDALREHCREASRIVEDFSGGWFSKTHFEGGITPEKTGNFAHVAFKKIGAELRKRSERP